MSKDVVKSFSERSVKRIDESCGRLDSTKTTYISLLMQELMDQKTYQKHSKELQEGNFSRNSQK